MSNTPDKLRISIYGRLPTPEMEIQWLPEKQRLAITGTSGESHEHEVSAENWQAFRNKAQSMGVWEWQSNPEVVFDGGQWQVELSDGDRHVSISGSMVLPGSTKGGRRIPSKHDIGELITAVRTLSSRR